MACEDVSRGVAYKGSRFPDPVVLAAGAVTCDQVSVLGAQGVDEERQVGRVVLAVAVERADDAAAGRAEPGPEGGRLARMLGQDEMPVPRVPTAHLCESGPALIGRSVVDPDAFPVPRPPGESRGQFPGEREDAVFLVEDGDDDGDVCHSRFEALLSCLGNRLYQSAGERGRFKFYRWSGSRPPAS